MAKKLILNEVIGSVSSGKLDQRLGFRVLRAINTHKYKIDQRISLDEMTDFENLGLINFDIIGKEYADK